MALMHAKTLNRSVAGPNNTMSLVRINSRDSLKRLESCGKGLA